MGKPTRNTLVRASERHVHHPSLSLSRVSLFSPGPHMLSTFFMSANNSCAVLSLHFSTEALPTRYLLLVLLSLIRSSH
jgi:hypothetical protein